MQSCVVSINQKRQVREAGKFTHLPKCSPSALPLRYVQCCTVELGTEPPEPADLALTHIPDSVPNPQSAPQALVTLRTTELTLVGRWLESRHVANLLYRESGRLRDREGAPNGEALGTRGLSGVDGKCGLGQGRVPLQRGLGVGSLWMQSPHLLLQPLPPAPSLLLFTMMPMD